MKLIIYTATLSWLLATMQLATSYAAAQSPDKSPANPKDNQPAVSKKISPKSCGVKGNPKVCTIDTTGFAIDQQDGTISDIDLGNGQVYTCRARGKKALDNGKGYHGSCSARGKPPPGIDGAGDLNVISRGKNSRGEDCMTGSLSAEGQICRIRPDAICDTTIVDCKPASEYPQDDHGSRDKFRIIEPQAIVPRVPPMSHEVELASFRTLVMDPVDKISGLRGSITATDLHRGLQVNDLGDNLDVLVVWTKAAECRNSDLTVGCVTTAQTEDNMRALIDLAVQETNTAFDLSGIETQLRLVHAYRDDSYAEVSGNAFNEALEKITGKTDGFMDDVHEKRTEYGADLVAMLIDNPELCGLAWSAPRPSKDIMFSVSSWSCATGYYTFGHEIGHNLGCWHDRGTEDHCSVEGTSYNYGWRDPGAEFRTILAYPCKTGQCDSSQDRHCPKAQRFSNPNFTYNGKPLGDTNNDNARQINDVKAQVAAFMTFLPECTANSDCEDSDLCTTNVCDGVCLTEPVDCNDHDECTIDSCSQGECVRTQVDCDDGNACTEDTCDPVAGCTNTPIPGCCGNGICEAGEESCDADCAVGPLTIKTPMCTSCWALNGNMFDVKAKDFQLRIESVQMHVYKASKAEVWTRAGTHVGSEFSSSGWTKVADSVVTASAWTVAEISITAVDIPAGATQAFYITFDGPGLVLFGLGTGSLSVADDEYMTVYEGPAIWYPFDGRTSAPYVWNGAFTYSKIIVETLPTSPSHEILNYL